MKYKQLLFLLFIITTNMYSLEVNIIGVSKNDNVIQIDVEISTETMVFLPENLLEDRITTGVNPLTLNDYQIFYSILIKSHVSNNRFVLAASNENLGVIRYWGRLHTLRLTNGVNYVPFSGRKNMSIIIDTINMPHFFGQDRFILIEQDNYIIDEIYLSICYSVIPIINSVNCEKMEDEILLNQFHFENIIKISSVTYRLKEPFIYKPTVTEN